MRNTTATGVPGRPRTPLWGRRRRKASSTWSINASSSSTSSMRRRAGSQSFSPSGRIISKMLRCACWRRTITPPRTASRLPRPQAAEFEAVKGENLKTGRAWAIKEALRPFWTYRYAQRAADYFRRWYFWATHSRLTPVVSAAKTLQAHLPNILTYFRHRLTNATAEGLNRKIQMVKEMACGFRNREHYKTAIYFHCGGLDLYPRLEASA